LEASLSARSSASVRPANASSMCRKLVMTYPRARRIAMCVGAPGVDFFDARERHDSRLSKFLDARNGHRGESENVSDCSRIIAAHVRTRHAGMAPLCTNATAPGDTGRARALPRDDVPPPIRHILCSPPTIRCGTRCRGFVSQDRRAMTDDANPFDLDLDGFYERYLKTCAMSGVTPCRASARVGPRVDRSAIGAAAKRRVSLLPLNHCALA